MISGDAEISRIMLHIYEEYQRKEIGYQLVCKGELLKLVTYLARNAASVAVIASCLRSFIALLSRISLIYCWGATPALSLKI